MKSQHLKVNCVHPYMSQRQHLRTPHRADTPEVHGHLMYLKDYTVGAQYQHIDPMLGHYIDLGDPNMMSCRKRQLS